MTTNHVYSDDTESWIAPTLEAAQEMRRAMSGVLSSDNGDLEPDPDDSETPLCWDGHEITDDRSQFVTKTNAEWCAILPAGTYWTTEF